MEETAQPSIPPENQTPPVTETPTVPVNMTPEVKKPFFSPISLFIIIAVILAAIGYAGYDYYMNLNAGSEPIIPVSNVAPEPVKKPLFLTVESPAEGDLISGNIVTVKGKTLPNAVVAVLADQDETTLDSDDLGNFEAAITLGEGINTLNITAFGEDGEEKSMDINLVYDKEI